MQISVTTPPEDTTDRAQLIVDAQQEDGAPLEQARIEAVLVAPDGVTQTVQLEQTAPGRYAGAVVADQPGVYLIQVNGLSAQGNPLQTQGGWSIPYSAEYLPAEPDTGAMARLASQAGGRLSTGNPAEVFVHDLSAAQAARPLWPYLLALAMILLPIDIAVRRLAWTPTRIALPQIWQLLRRRERRAAPQPGATISAWRQVHRPPMDTLSTRSVTGDVQPTVMDERINKIELGHAASLSPEQVLPSAQAVSPDQPLPSEARTSSGFDVSPDQAVSAPSLAARLLDSRRKKKDRSSG
jgi:hypothetical protein